MTPPVPRTHGVCVGTPIGSNRVLVSALDADGRATGAPTAAAGVLGEIVVSAPHLKDHYDRLWLTDRAAAETRSVSRALRRRRWHRTGDVGHLDDRRAAVGRGADAARHRRPPTGRSRRSGRAAGGARRRRAPRGRRRRRPARTSAGRRGSRDPAARSRVRLADPEVARAVRASTGIRSRRRARRAAPAHRHPAQLEDRPVAALGVGGPDARGRRGPSPHDRPRHRRHRGSSVARSRLSSSAAGHEVRTLQRRASGVAGATDIARLDHRSAPSSRRRPTARGGWFTWRPKSRSPVGPNEFARSTSSGTRTVLDAAERCRRVPLRAGLVAVGRALRLVTRGGRAPDPPTPSTRAATTHGPRRRRSCSPSRPRPPAMHVVAVRPHIVWGPGDTQLVGAHRRRAHAPGRLPLLDGGTALIDTTYVDNACDRHPRRPRPRRRRHTAGPYVLTNGEPRPVGDLLAGICAGRRRAAAAMERARVARPRRRLRHGAPSGRSCPAG